MSSSLTRWFFLLAASLAATSATAQTGLDLVDVDIAFVGAHPDDDSGVLGTFARYLLDEGFRGTVVTATGGEGGGNAIGPEAGRSLGLIRKEEERRALALVGVDSPSFLGLTDFYFTLSAEEVARKWGEDYVCEVVRHVRLERPEVIVTMWPGPGTHGQHQMAARAATLAFEKAPDPTYCPDQIEVEHLRPWTPLKLYYYDREGGTTLEVPTDDFSRSRAMRYADIKALAMAKYRSQGFDQFLKIPVAEPRPEAFMLVRSRVPVAQPEHHLLEGALLPAGSSPPGMRLGIVPSSFSTGIGRPLEVEVVLENRTGSPLDETVLSIQPPEGWTARTTASGAPVRVEPEGETSARFELTPAAGVGIDENALLGASYAARSDGRPIAGGNFTWVQARVPVSARFVPLFDVASYRDFARETHTDWVLETLPTRLPLYIGRVSRARVTIDNASTQEARGSLELDLPRGIALRSKTDYRVGPLASTTLELELAADESVLPEGRHSAKIPLAMSTTVDGLSSRDVADVYALPTLVAPRASVPPEIDGDLGDMAGLARGEISPKDLWWRRAPADAADASAEFFLGYDSRALYVGIRVHDETVVCNIAPDDVRAQLRSDAIGVTVDPSGASRDTSTTLQAAAFPCTTAGFEARGFRDADARQGLMEETAPGMKVASRRLQDGYSVEFSIPWSAMPEQPSPGDEIGLNVVVYDGDLKDARVGANISESGLAWAAFEWGGKQALPYLWPRVVLGR